MNPSKITYASWEGEAALLAHYADGRIHGFLYMNEQWGEANAADIATKATSLDKEVFEKMFPGVGLPSFG